MLNKGDLKILKKNPITDNQIQIYLSVIVY